MKTAYLNRATGSSPLLPYPTACTGETGGWDGVGWAVALRLDAVGSVIVSPRRLRRAARENQACQWPSPGIEKTPLGPGAATPCAPRGAFPG